MTSKSARARLALFAAALAAPAILLGSSPANAAILSASQIMTQFNAVVWDEFSTSSDVEGRLVAGDIKNTNSATFYAKPNALSGTSAFKGVNAVTITSCPSCNINNGGGLDFTTSNAGTYNFNGGGSATKNSPSFAISDFTAPLNAYVTQLSALTANSTVNASSNSIVFNVTPVKNVAVFTLTASQLAQQNANISFLNETSASTIIINVTGGNFAEAGGENFNSDLYEDEHVIWNFEGATSLSFGTWGGAILGEAATVSNSSALNGFLYAKTFNGNGELHAYPFVGRVPEPETWAMMIVGFGGIGLLTRRRRSKAMAAA